MESDAKPTGCYDMEYWRVGFIDGGKEFKWHGSEAERVCPFSERREGTSRVMSLGTIQRAEVTASATGSLRRFFDDILKVLKHRMRLKRLEGTLLWRTLQ